MPPRLPANATGADRASATTTVNTVFLNSILGVLVDWIAWCLVVFVLPSPSRSGCIIVPASDSEFELIKR